MPENWTPTVDRVIPTIPSDSEFHSSKWWNFDSKAYLSFLLNLMVVYNASDIYLTFWEVPVLRVEQEALRVDWALLMTDNVLSDFKKLFETPEDEKIFNTEKSIDLWYSLHSRRYRINISLQRWHIMIVGRLLAEKIPTIDELGLPVILKKLAHTSWGIVFLSWPTWSWKSTTLAAMIEEINQTRYKHIITIEDPIEYVFEPKKSVFEQKELWKDVTSFASAMKYAVRQRPDVILFGEIRDPDSVRYAMSLAETGHLVLTTVHSRSAEQAINRLVSMFPTDEQPQIMNHLAENMIAIIIQKLVKKKTWHGVVAVHEILLNNTPVSNTIRENKLNQIDNVIFTNKKYWMQLLDESLVDRIVKWDISLQTAMENARDQSTIRRWLEQLWVKFN